MDAYPLFLRKSLSRKESYFVTGVVVLLGLTKKYGIPLKLKYKRITQLKRRGYQPMPLRRVHIKKSNGKLRPLGIPTMKDRAMQALYLMALEPVVRNYS